MEDSESVSYLLVGGLRKGNRGLVSGREGLVPSVPASGLGRVDPLEQKKPSQHCPPASVALALGQNLPPSQA